MNTSSYINNKETEVRVSKPSPVFEGNYEAKRFSRAKKRKYFKRKYRGLIEKNRDARILVILHLFYYSAVDEIIEYLKNLEDYHVKLIITYAKEFEQHRLLHKFDRFGNVEYRAYPNQGYDLGSFLDVLNDVNLSDWDVVFKLQSKSTKSDRYTYSRYFDRREWFLRLFDGTVGAECVHTNINRILHDETCGMIADSKLIVEDPPYRQKLTRRELKAFAGIDTPDSYHFVIGTCFAAKPTALKMIRKQHVTIDDFGELQYGVFSFAHALERALCFLPEQDGLQICGIRTEQQNEDTNQKLAEAKYEENALRIPERTGIRFSADDMLYLEGQFPENYEIKNVRIGGILTRDPNGKLGLIEDFVLDGDDQFIGEMAARESAAEEAAAGEPDKAVFTEVAMLNHDGYLVGGRKALSEALNKQGIDGTVQALMFNPGTRPKRPMHVPNRFKRLYQLAVEHGDVDYSKIIAREGNELAIRFLSKCRENALAWYPFKTQAQILEVGCGCGEITGGLLGDDRYVTALAEREYEAQIIRARYAAHPRLSLREGTIRTMLTALMQECGAKEPAEYDYIVLRGNAERVSELACLSAKLLKPDGTMIMIAQELPKLTDLSEGAANNTVREDKTRIIHMITETLAKSGLSDTRQYDLFPNDIYTRYLFTEKRPPAEGELSGGKPAFFVSNSGACLIEARKSAFDCGEVIFAKISNERAKAYAVITYIDGEGRVFKKPVCEEGRAHLAHIEEAYRKLSDQYGNDLLFNKARLKNDLLELEKVEGDTLETVLLKLTAAGKQQKALGVIDRYRDILIKHAADDFTITDRFREIFMKRLRPEDEEVLSGKKSSAVTDVDPIFSNVIPDGEIRQIIDYEWTFDFPVPVDYVLWRSLFYFTMIDEIKKTGYDYFRHYGISEEEQVLFLQMELSMQSYIAGDAIFIDGQYARFI